MYTVSLERFEGPLDLLLHLIEKSELDIKDIFVSEITSQYLSYMQGLEELEPDAASEFAAVAATLLLIKSRMLLPKPEPVLAEEEDAEVALLRQLREYKQFKEAGEELAVLKESADRAFSRLPEEFPKQPPKVDLEGVTADALYESFITIMLKLDKRKTGEPVRRVSRDAFNIGDRISYLGSVLAKRGSVAFSELFSEESTRMELIVTFMALLELLAGGSVKAEQRDLFGEITITAAKELSREGA